MLQIVGGERPVAGPAGEEDHLLASGGVLVDDGSNSVGGEGTGGAELGESGGDAGIGDGRRAVPETRGRDPTATIHRFHPVSQFLFSPRTGYGTYVLRLAVGNSETSLKPTFCSTPVSQHPPRAVVPDSQSQLSMPFQYTAPMVNLPNSGVG